MRTLIVGLLASSAALADSTTMTFVCTDEKGRKAIQDSPCPETHVSRTVPTIQHQPTFDDALRRFSDRSRNDMTRANCNSLRRSASASDRRRAIDECKGF